MEQTCPKCTTVWNPTLVYERLTMTRRWFIRYYQCDVCDFIEKKTERAKESQP